MIALASIQTSSSFGSSGEHLFTKRMSSASTRCLFFFIGMHHCALISSGKTKFALDCCRCWPSPISLSWNVPWPRCWIECLVPLSAIKQPHNKVQLQLDFGNDVLHDKGEFYGECL